MANGNQIGQFRDELEQDVTEVAQDVKDSVGEALEQGVQSVVGTQLTPQQIQQKQQEDQENLAEARRTIQFLKQIDEEQKRVRQENKQIEQQRLQTQQQEEQKEEMKKEEKKKQPINPALAYAGKAEIKRGVGG
ncbi:hypothetical protein HYW43_00965 [Candidatus Daviesbacteria bacterium]|nr:hypothetical protein [Candidatus Daviesbacteria bacterium]